MLKTEVKQIYKDYADSLTCGEVRNLTRKISNIINHDFIIDELTTVYIDIPGEDDLFNTWPIIDYIITNKPDISVITSCLVNGQYRLFEITNTTCYYRENGCFNPLEVDEFDGEHIDVIFINVECFDKSGYFVQNNKTRAIDICNPDTFSCLKLVGISFFEPVYKIQDIYINERKLDGCIIPNEYYEFKMN